MNNVYYSKVRIGSFQTFCCFIYASRQKEKSEKFMNVCVYITSVSLQKIRFKKIVVVEL
jgi:hypothetical protein